MALGEAGDGYVNPFLHGKRFGGYDTHKNLVHI